MLQWRLDRERSRDLKPSHNSHCIQPSTHKWPGWDCCTWRSGQLKPHTHTTNQDFSEVPMVNAHVPLCMLSPQCYYNNNNNIPCASAHYQHHWIHSRVCLKKRKLDSYPKLRDIWRFKAKSPGPSLNPGFSAPNLFFQTEFFFKAVTKSMDRFNPKCPVIPFLPSFDSSVATYLGGVPPILV